MEQFRNEDREVRDEAELRELLGRLDRTVEHVETLADNDPTHYTTVEDIAEALGLSPAFVADELRKLHAEHREAKLHSVLRELEEPIHRVERPGLNQSHHSDPIFRLKSVQALVERHHKEPTLPRRDQTENKKAEEFSTRVGMIVLAAVGILGLLAVVAQFLR